LNLCVHNALSGRLAASFTQDVASASFSGTQRLIDRALRQLLTAGARGSAASAASGYPPAPAMLFLAKPTGAKSVGVYNTSGQVTGGRYNLLVSIKRIITGIAGGPYGSNPVGPYPWAPDDRPWFTNDFGFPRMRLAA